MNIRKGKVIILENVHEEEKIKRFTEMNKIKTLRNVPSDFQSSAFNGGKWIKHMRRSFDPEITQMKLAELSGLTQNEISRLETGMVEKISLEQAARLAWVFGLDIEDVAKVFGVWR